MDRRNAERFNMQLNCFLTPVGRPAERMKGSSENFSRIGIMVKLASSPALMLAPGDDVDIDLLLPHNRGRRSRSLHCMATVVRVQAGPELYVACSIQHLSFRELPQHLHAAIADPQQPNYLI